MGERRSARRGRKAVRAIAVVSMVFGLGWAAELAIAGADNAHPSGNDRSIEPGQSGTQGNASSDPDDDGNGPDRTNGGADQPGGPGGVDLSDQDGNNGCGNDNDFEDDNEGLCRPYTNPNVPALGPSDR